LEGVSLTAGSKEVDGYLFSFQKYLTNLGFAESTVRNYLADIHAFIRWFEKAVQEEFSPKGITYARLQEFALALRRGGKRPATVRRKLTGLRAFLFWAKAEGVAADLPALPRLKRRCRRPPLALSREEQELLARTVKQTGSSRDQAIVFLILDAGLALEELLGLTRKDVRFTGQGAEVMVRRKNRSRAVPVGPRAAASLREYLAEWPKGAGGTLFQGRKGALGPRAVQHVLAGYAARCGLDGKVNASTLRRTFAANALEAGEDPCSVAERMGISERSLRALLAGREEWEQ
jgi:site-specific recombinase XerD